MMQRWLAMWIVLVLAASVCGCQSLPAFQGGSSNVSGECRDTMAKAGETNMIVDYRDALLACDDLASTATAYTQTEQIGRFGHALEASCGMPDDLGGDQYTPPASAEVRATGACQAWLECLASSDDGFGWVSDCYAEVEGEL